MAPMTTLQSNSMGTDQGSDLVHHRDEKNVGILGIEVYTSAMYIQQSELEKYNQVPTGKYTIGLGQELISIVNGDNEDINSICLTVVHNLLEKYVDKKHRIVIVTSYFIIV